MPTNKKWRNKMKGHFNNNRDFGVEIEFLIPRNQSQQTVSDTLNNVGINCRVESYNHTTRPHWKIVNDVSVNGDSTHYGGNELVSPRLNGQDGLDQLELVLDTLKLLGCKVNKSCGLHVHHDVTDIVNESDATATKFLKNLVLFCAKYEHIIYKLIAPSRLDRRGYSVPVRRNFFSRSDMRLNNELSTIKSNLDRRVKIVVNDKSESSINGNLQHGRTCGLNLYKIWDRGSVEFRYHNGSLNFTKIKSWIVLTNAIVNSVESTNFVKLCNVPNGSRGLASFRGAIGFVGRSGSQSGTPYTNDRLTKDANLYIQRRYRAAQENESAYSVHSDYGYVRNGVFHNNNNRG